MQHLICKGSMLDWGRELSSIADVPKTFFDGFYQSAVAQLRLYAYCCDYIFVQSAYSHGAYVQKYEESSSVTDNVYLPMNQFFIRTMSGI